jgi:hypothetical protein
MNSYGVLSALGLLAASLSSLGADCGGCPPSPGLPKPMTENRAREIDPSISEGLGVSTTLITGDCRPMPGAPLMGCSADSHPRCFNERASMRVIVLPTNISIPHSTTCAGAFAVADLEQHALVNARSSDQGELVAAIADGRYSIYVSKDDQCATCGLADAGIACLVDVPRDRIVTRDLVLDEAAH